MIRSAMTHAPIAFAKRKTDTERERKKETILHHVNLIQIRKNSTIKGYNVKK